MRCQLFFFFFLLGSPLASSAVTDEWILSFFVQKFGRKPISSSEIVLVLSSGALLCMSACVCFDRFFRVAIRSGFVPVIVVVSDWLFSRSGLEKRIMEWKNHLSENGRIMEWISYK